MLTWFVAIIITLEYLSLFLHVDFQLGFMSMQLPLSPMAHMYTLLPNYTHYLSSNCLSMPHSMQTHSVPGPFLQVTQLEAVAEVYVVTGNTCSYLANGNHSLINVLIEC